MIGILLLISFIVSLGFFIGVAAYVFGKAFHELDESRKLIKVIREEDELRQKQIEARNAEIRRKKEMTKLRDEVYRIELENRGLVEARLS